MKKRGVVDSDELLNELDIDPGESDLVKAVSRQLESLESYGLFQLSISVLLAGFQVVFNSIGVYYRS